jgi:signal transduction histidine kinase
MEGSAKAKNIFIDYDIQDDLYIYADYEMSKTILRNLITNAIKFTPKNGNIRISTVTKESEIHVSILDSGVGISPLVLKSLFKLGESR